MPEAQEWPLRDATEFACLPSAARRARRHAADLLERWRLRGAIETVELLVSELVTNAYRASGVDVERDGYAALAGTAEIGLRLASDRRLLLIEVWDANPEPPVIKESGPDVEGGRGLFLVGCLSRQWNYYFPTGNGKVVWCELPVEGGD
ncbi:ATP-binding protein [Actinomadura craniellae]|nr:ATP-binding protein [Actinomadura craniellae]